MASRKNDISDKAKNLRTV